MPKIKISTILTFFFITLGAGIMFLPYWFMVVLSLETIAETVAIPPHVMPPHPVVSNFARVFTDLNFGRNFFNTLLITSSLVFGQIILCSMAGYAFARLYFPFKHILFFLFLVVFLLPGVVLLLPRYLLAKELGVIDTLRGVIIFELLSCFGTFLYRQHFLSVPTNFEEAAIVDGANIWQIYLNIAIPLSKGLSISFGVLVFVFGWNLFLWPLIILASSEKLPITVALAQIEGQYFGDWALMIAAALVATIFPIIIFIILQKKINLAAVFTGLK